MQILNIAGYKFISLDGLPQLQQDLLNQCSSLALKGTILISPEGINISLAGPFAAINAFKTFLRNDERFSDMTFRESESGLQPFRLLKVKIKKEIITLRDPASNPIPQRAPHLSPQQFKQWLDENRDMVVFDTRNDYEVQFGTFENALNLQLNHFSELPNAIHDLPKDKPIIMFCTGGIRCEKAAVHMLNQGFSEVYQLDGGILNYFKEVGGAHYHGECFVFDERVSVKPDLSPSGTKQCTVCQGPLFSDQDATSHSCVSF